MDSLVVAAIGCGSTSKGMRAGASAPNASDHLSVFQRTAQAILEQRLSGLRYRRRGTGIFPPTRSPPPQAATDEIFYMLPEPNHFNLGDVGPAKTRLCQ